MRCFVSAAVVALGVAGLAAFQPTEDKVEAFNEAVRDPMVVIRQHRRGEWPTDFQMQKYCVDQQTEGINDLAKLFESASGNAELFAAFTQCAVDWTTLTGDGQYDVDFQMVA